jgi:hypothetical protein
MIVREAKQWQPEDSLRANLTALWGCYSPEGRSLLRRISPSIVASHELSVSELEGDKSSVLYMEGRQDGLRGAPPDAERETVVVT